MRHWIFRLFFIIAILCQINSYGQASFTVPDTICVNAPVTITNTTVGASTNFWNFCVANPSTPPVGTNLGNIGSQLTKPVYIDYVFENGNYYGFVVNNSPGKLTRLDFGNSLLNTPVAVNLGDINGTIPNTAEGLQVVKNEEKWYVIIVGGDASIGITSYILRVDLGTSISNNSPAATNWGNMGNLSYPHDLFVFDDGSGHFYVFTLNTYNNTITRFDFGSSFTNPPAATNLGNIGALNSPTGLHAIQDNGKWYVFVTNAANSTLSRLDFGSSLLSMPVGVNLGNPGGVFKTCWDIYLMKFCGSLSAFVLNAANSLVKLDFGSLITNTPIGTDMGNLGNLDFPHCLSKIFRVGADLYSLVPNVNNNTITRFRFVGCSNASTPNSTSPNPPAITYNTPGTYNINLTIDDGFATQSTFCKQVVVLPAPSLDFSFVQDICNPKSIAFKNESASSTAYSWDFGNGTISALSSPSVAYSSYNNYTVKLKTTSGCTDSVIKQISVQVLPDSLVKNNDTVICKGTSVQLNSLPALSHCWTPANGLSSTSIANPVATPLSTTTYYLNAQTVSNNLVINGDFSNGNTGFTSAYNYTSNNITEAQYYVGTNPKAWNGGMSACQDHSTSSGNMLLINGAPVADVGVWKQTITVVPNTNYAFSAWLQALHQDNPAQLQFSINGKTIGNLFSAVLPTCNWKQFYTTWNSGTTTTAVISIVNKNTFVQGNDFALDDISFAELKIKTDSVRITVADAPLVKANNDTIVCAGKGLQLNASGTLFYSWDQPSVLSDTSISNPVARPVKDTFFVVKGYDVKGCFSTDTVKVTVLPGSSVDFSFVQDACNPKSVQFKNESVNTQAGTTYSWNFGNNATSNAVNPPAVIYSNYNTYTVKLKSTGNCADSITKQILVNLSADNVITTNDTAVCKNSSVQLNALPAVNYCWSPTTGLSNTSIATPVASPLATTTYFVNSQVTGNNLAVNGDFSAGNTGFSSAYAYSNSGIPEGVYYVDKNSYPWHPFLGSSVDHTTGTGNMLLVNGSTVADVAVWKQSITIQPNTNYVFSVWLQSIFSGNPAQLQFSINGKTIGSLFTASNTAFAWQQFYTTWNSGSSTSAVISIVNKNTIVTGNDFALDDISFSELSMKTDSVKVTVVDKPVIITNKDTAICKNTSLQLNTTGAGFYKWNISSYLSDTTIANPVARPLKDTIFIVKGYNLPGCFASDTVKVTVLSLPSLSITKDTTICTGKNIGLTATTNASKFNWQPAATLSSAIVFNPVATPVADTKYYVTVTDANTCISKDSVVITGAALPMITTLKDTAVCSGSSVTLTTISNGASFLWSPAAGLQNNTIISPVAKPQLSTQYIVTVTNAANCQAKDTVNITLLSTPSLVNKSADDTLCIGGSAQLLVNALNGTSYNWSPLQGLSNSTIKNPIASPVANTKYYVKVTGSNNCSLTDSVSITVKPYPVFSVSPASATICEGDTIKVTASGGDLYQWSPITSVKNPAAAVTTVFPTVSTLYSISVTDTFCAVSSNVYTNIVVNKAPVVTLSKSNDADCVIGTVKLNASGAARYLWFPSETLINGVTAKPTATPYQTTFYHVKAYSDKGCVREDSIEVKVIKGVAENGYLMPSAFTPNGDGVNDCYGVKQWGFVTDLQLIIYNRYGEKVFTSNNIYNCWNGTYKGYPQQPGTYVYEVSAKTICGNVYRKGTFVLIR